MSKCYISLCLSFFGSSGILPLNLEILMEIEFSHDNTFRTHSLTRIPLSESVKIQEKSEEP